MTYWILGLDFDQLKIKSTILEIFYFSFSIRTFLQNFSSHIFQERISNIATYVNPLNNCTRVIQSVPSLLSLRTRTSSPIMSLLSGETTSANNRIVTFESRSSSALAENCGRSDVNLARHAQAE